MTRTSIPDPVLGFYGPGSHMWRINREAVLLGAGPAALLLQIAHPLIAEGVAQHSDFERDPFARLRSTLRTTMDMVFGDGPTASRALRRLNAVHATVRGDVTDPAAHAATGAQPTAPSIPSCCCGSRPRSSSRVFAPTDAGSGRSPTRTSRPSGRRLARSRLAWESRWTGHRPHGLRSLPGGTACWLRTDRSR